MINFLSSWAEQVILAVIIATILELILPNSKNKKYVQMVIGVYVLFNIISPIIKNKEKLVFSEIDLDKYITTSTKVEQSSMDARLEKIYLDELENNIKSKFKNVGIEIIKCTIDVELDTTKKNAGIHSIDVKVKNVDDEQKILKLKQEIIEEYEISEEVAKRLNLAKKENRRIIAVGTTVVRTLEANVSKFNEFKAEKASTNIFITPGYTFKAIDCLITNFHLPKSTLIMLVSAFIGREFTLSLYNHAVKEKYMFFSFGDAMFIYGSKKN